MRSESTNEIAIILAAGMGSRMRPLTDKTAKPLVEVHGVPLIETIIHGLEYRGVRRIYIITGYRKEQFSYLEEKYTMVSLIYNASYSIANNISSVFAACNMIRESDADIFICEADLYLKSEAIFAKKLHHSGYYGKKVTGYSDDWVFEQDDSGRICRIKKGGTNCFNMVGISFFLRKDAVFLVDKIEEVFMDGANRDLFWDEVVDREIDKIPLIVYETTGDMIAEVDTIKELAVLDERYNEYL